MVIESESDGEEAQALQKLILRILDYKEQPISKQESLADTFLVRHLEPGSNGLPIEVYVIAKTIEWGKYEDIQADIFDHIFAVVPQFDLKIFQYPTGKDFQNVGSKSSNYN